MSENCIVYKTTALLLHVFRNLKKCASVFATFDGLATSLMKKLVEMLTQSSKLYLDSSSKSNHAYFNVSANLRDMLAES
jgi:hypothetical protein